MLYQTGIQTRHHLFQWIKKVDLVIQKIVIMKYTIKISENENTDDNDINDLFSLVPSNF